ncbi:hypothetical protein NQ314_015471, partial [Rhamnusium bicolor]
MKLLKIKEKEKKQIKEYRRERRIEKKMNAEAFKDEAKRQVKISINNRNNIQGNKIFVYCAEKWEVELYQQHQVKAGKKVRDKAKWKRELAKRN